MPRGRKKKVVETLEEKITRLTKEVDEMSAALKAKKKELRLATREKAKADKKAEEEKAAKEKEKIVAAVQNAVSSGEKTLDEIMDFLK